MHILLSIFCTWGKLDFNVSKDKSNKHLTEYLTIITTHSTVTIYWCSYAVIYTRSVKSIELLINFAPFVIILCLWNIQRCFIESQCKYNYYIYQ